MVDLTPLSSINETSVVIDALYSIHIRRRLLLFMYSKTCGEDVLYSIPRRPVLLTCRISVEDETHQGVAKKAKRVFRHMRFVRDGDGQFIYDYFICCKAL
jgi:hypothetical protein